MNIGDDVTINGTIVYVSKLTETVVVRTKTGDELTVYRNDINTIHPFQPLPEKDERKGK